jgi:hypothetical protein
LLERLANAPEDILSDIPLIEGLEATKLAAKEIAAAVAEGKKTEIDINLAREIYRPVASEGAMLYFLLTMLCAIEHMYQYSLDSFVSYFYKSIERATPAEKLPDRVVGHKVFKVDSIGGYLSFFSNCIDEPPFFSSDNHVHHGQSWALRAAQAHFLGATHFQFDEARQLG